MGPEGAEREHYHHGDLPAALRAAALELVGERGVPGFTLAEAARRVGVSGAAPYRHYADREALLAALAAEGYQVSADRLLAVRGGHPSERLAGMAAAYVRFAGEQRARFQVLFGAGLDKHRHPEVAVAAEAAFGLVRAEVARLPAPQPCLAQDLWALAHGYASLLVEGDPPDGLGLVAAAEAARSAASRLLAGSLDATGHVDLE